MKKLIAFILVSITSIGFCANAHADGWHGGYRGPAYRGPVYNYNYNHGGYRGGWVAPALAGVIVGAAIARPYYAQPTVVYTPPPVYVPQPYNNGFHQETILDGNCNCYRTVLVPN